MFILHVFSNLSLAEAKGGGCVGEVEGLGHSRTGEIPQFTAHVLQGMSGGTDRVRHD